MNPVPQPNCIECIGLGFKNYCNFNGRARRAEFFYFFCLFYIIGEILSITYISLVLSSVRYDDYYYYYGYSYETYPAFLVVIFLFWAATFIPILSVTVRRLHDTGRPGAVVLLLIFLPLIGLIVILIFCCEDSMPMNNEYGPSPKFLASDPLVVQPAQPMPAVYVQPPVYVSPAPQPQPAYIQPMPPQPNNVYAMPNPIQPGY